MIKHIFNINIKMRWYEGDIAQAVATSKSKNAIFVVYIEGKDEKSTNLTSLINDDDVSSKLESEIFVAIKLEAGSVPHNQFSAIYKSVTVPSLFFIGKNGKPIDIIVESSSVNDLSSRLNTIIEIHSGILPWNSQTSPGVSLTVPNVTTSNDVGSKSTNLSEELIKGERDNEKASEKSDISVNVECENEVCHKVSDMDVASNSKELLVSPSNEESKQAKEEKGILSKEKKIERAKDLVEIKREAKKKEEEEAERLKEIERRKAGQDVQKLRRWQQDQEMKNLMEERQRTRNEEKAARDRILAQIAQDKADRAAKFGTPPPVVSHQSEVVHRPSAAPSINQNVARLQFKLPDGSSRTQNFESMDTLQDVTNFVAQNLDLPFKNFSLSTTFPRREFSTYDLEKTLRELELCPNAVILILPAQSTSAVVSPDGGGFMSLIWFLLSPILGFFGYFRNLIFGQSEEVIPQPPERSKRNNEEISGQPQQSNKRKATEATTRRQGSSNIHRLSDRTDSDDENNTWNGNSTQQM